MTLKRLLLVALAISATACKVHITVPEGGKVVDANGATVCEAGQTCEIQVVDIFFDEEFTAMPADGFRFVHWDKVHRGFCGRKEEPCHLYTSAFEGQDALMAFRG